MKIPKKLLCLARKLLSIKKLMKKRLWYSGGTQVCHVVCRDQQERPSSSHSTVSEASTLRSLAGAARFGGGSSGQERERLRVSNRRERPAPRRGPADAEAERIAQIMASHRGQPWQPDGFGHD